LRASGQRALTNLPSNRSYSNQKASRALLGTPLTGWRMVDVWNEPQQQPNRPKHLRVEIRLGAEECDNEASVRRYGHRDRGA
jgi:hypothetical protein